MKIVLFSWNDETNLDWLWMAVVVLCTFSDYVIVLYVEYMCGNLATNSTIGTPVGNMKIFVTAQCSWYLQSDFCFLSNVLQAEGKNDIQCHYRRRNTINIDKTIKNVIIKIIEKFNPQIDSILLL